MTSLRTVLSHPLPRRAGEAAITLLGVSLLTFVVLRVVPGDQITAAYGIAAGELSPEQIRSLQAYYGIDQPLPVQYLAGSAESSPATSASPPTRGCPSPPSPRRPCRTPSSWRSWRSSWGCCSASPVAMLAASRPGRARDGVTQLGSLVALSVPSFLLATAVATFLANQLGWYPNGEGYRTLLEDPWLNLQQMLLPATVLGISIASPVLQTTRAAILGIRAEDYVRTARAKGVPPRRLQVRHILRNALIPVVTMTGLQFGFLLSGALVAEQIFAIPGIGRQVLLGLNQQEYAVVQSTVLVIAAIFVLVNLLTDLVYRLVDPRVRVR